VEVIPPLPWVGLRGGAPIFVTRVRGAPIFVTRVIRGDAPKFATVKPGILTPQHIIAEHFLTPAEMRGGLWIFQRELGG